MRFYFAITIVLFAALSGFAAERLPTQVKEIVPTSKTQQSEWKYTLETPPENWFQNDFDDSAWKTGKGGFGNGYLPGNPPIGTSWTTNEIWLRREFELPALPEGELQLYVYYDESPEIWINGVFAGKANGHTTAYVLLPITSAAKETLKPGKNQFAVKASQTTGGQYIDIGLVQEVSQDREELKNQMTFTECMLDNLKEKFPVIVFAKHFDFGGSHYSYTEAQSDAQQERNFKPGSALCLLELGEDGQYHERTLIADANGVIRDPDVTFDGKKIIFAWKKSDREDDYHLYEYTVETGDIRQLTLGSVMPITNPAYSLMGTSFLTRLGAFR